MLLKIYLRNSKIVIDIKYKRKSIDFNEYGFNKNYFEDENLLNYVAKSGPNFVKKNIKR